jgi:hypothetical protein
MHCEGERFISANGYRRRHNRLANRLNRQQANGSQEGRQWGFPELGQFCIRFPPSTQALRLLKSAASAFFGTTWEAADDFYPGTDLDNVFEAVSVYLHCFRHSPEMYLIAGASRDMGLHRRIQIVRRCASRIPSTWVFLLPVPLKQACVGSGQCHPNSMLFSQ